MSNCTMFHDMFHLKEPITISVNDALVRIKDGASKIRVEDVRNALDKDKANEIKKLLPCILFSGTFKERADNAIIQHSGYLVLDFDNVDLGTRMAELHESKYIYAAWISPSGNGIKALVKIADGSKHREHFAALREIFTDADKSGVNESRICFESYDPNIWVKKSEIFTKLKTIEKIEQRQIVSDEKQIFVKVLKWATNKKGAFVKGERNSFIFKLAGGCCRYGIHQQSAEYMIICEYPPSNDFTTKEAQTTIKSAYKQNASKFGTAVFENDRLVDKVTRTEVTLSEDTDMEAPSRDVIYGVTVKENARSIYSKGYEKVTGIGVKKIDELFKTKKGELTALTGIGNYGKSAFYKWFTAMRILLFGSKTAAFCPEDNPPEEYYHDFVEIILGKNCTPFNVDGTKNEDRPPQYEYDNCYDFISKHIFYLFPKETSATPDYILERFLEVIIKEKVDTVCVDPWNQLSHEHTARTDQYLENLLGRWQRFGQINDIYNFIIIHPKQMPKLPNGNYECPDKFDMAGGAMWNNKLDNLLVYHRPLGTTEPNNPLAEFHTKKIKRQKSVGKRGFIELSYCRKTRRFEIDGHDPMQELINNLRLDFNKPIENYQPKNITEVSDSMKRFIEKNGFQTKDTLPANYWNDNDN